MLKSLRKSLSATMVTASAMIATAVPALANTPNCDPNTDQICPPTGFFENFDNLFNDILRITLAIAALLVFFYLIWGGIEWITSGGDKGKTEKARDKITASIIGLIILAASWAIIQIVLRFLGVDGGINSLIDNAVDGTNN